MNRLVHDSAKAVNNNELESLASTLKADFEDLTQATKARLLNAAPVLANMKKRSMRHGKRQGSIPGAQSIGPNLDDAQKVDLSGILGHAGTLDPLGQLSQSGPGQLVDELPANILAPLQAVSPFAQLDEDSVDRGINPDLSAILGEAGTLDPNHMLSPQAGLPGSVVDKVAVQDPYAGIGEAAGKMHWMVPPKRPWTVWRRLSWLPRTTTLVTRFLSSPSRQLCRGWFCGCRASASCIGVEVVPEVRQAELAKRRGCYYRKVGNGGRGEMEREPSGCDCTDELLMFISPFEMTS